MLRSKTLHLILSRQDDRGLQYNISIQRFIRLESIQCFIRGDTQCRMFSTTINKLYYYDLLYLVILFVSIEYPYVVFYRLVQSFRLSISLEVVYRTKLTLYSQKVGQYSLEFAYDQTTLVRHDAQWQTIYTKYIVKEDYCQAIRGYCLIDGDKVCYLYETVYNH